MSEGELHEIAPGIVHWTARHERIHSQVSSYLLVRERVVLDPMPPAEGFAALADRFGEPRSVVLTNRHHYRHAAELQQAFGATVHCHEAGMHQFTHGERVLPFAFGDELPGGCVAHEVGAICPDETAVWFPAERALAFADGLVRMPPDGALGFVPDSLLGDDPELVKEGLRRAFGGLVALAPEHLLLAHGLPWVGGATDALAAVAGRPLVVVGFDGSECSRTALDQAVDEATMRAGTLRIVTAWSVPIAAYGGGAGLTAPAVDADDFERAAAAISAEGVARARDRAPDLEIDATTPQDDARAALLAAAEGAALLVVGSRGHGGLARLVLGSVSHDVARHARCPVTVVHCRD